MSNIMLREIITLSAKQSSIQVSVITCLLAPLSLLKPSLSTSKSEELEWLLEHSSRDKYEKMGYTFSLWTV